MTDATFIFAFETLNEQHGELVGGKGLNLAIMTRAGLPVPPGFCVSSEAYSAARTAANANGQLQIDDALRAQIVDAYRKLGGGLVAVRSSATLEDGADFSFAGQQETILGVSGEEAVAAAVRQCWESLHTPRAIAYRRKQGIDDAAIAMAVVVQRLVESEVSGVLFTRDPLDATGRRMLIEAARGLGESVVSGAVMPDRFHTDWRTGDLLDEHVHEQKTMRTAEGVVELSGDDATQSCLTREQLSQITDLGRQVEDFYGEPRDVEWGYAQGKFWLLQSRPITTAAAAEIDQSRLEEIERLEKLAAARTTVWARYNLAEVLPEPTPMTWSIVKPFMSGSGGYGQMYVDLGYEPDDAVRREGFFDLICGRPYVNLSREPGLYFHDFPYGYPVAKLKANPSLAIYPTPQFVWSRATPRALLKLPLTLWKMWRAGRRMKSQPRTFAEELTQRILPRFAEEVRQARRNTDFTKLKPAELLAFVNEWIRRTLLDFARYSLRPSMFAATAMNDLEQTLAAALGPVRAKVEAQALMSGVHPPADSDLAAALKALSEGRMSHTEFAHHFGHRGANEMELASPRWIETPDQLPLPVGWAPPTTLDHSDEEVGSAHPTTSTAAAAAARLEWLIAVGGLEDQRPALLAALHTARTYLGLREAAKHYMMMGYALIRAALVELGKRFGLGEGIFFLELAELPTLIEGGDVATLRKLIDQRRRRRKLLLSIHAPPVIFSDDLEAIGRPVVIEGAAELKGTPVSFGAFEGVALVLTEPVMPAGMEDGFVLVCPSTDPAWVPLFLKAKALVMETGGVLSHGAIVAREFGIPAVAGFPDLCAQLRTGQRLHVDGTSGVVHVFDDAKNT